MIQKYNLAFDLILNFAAPWLLFTWLSPSLGAYQSLLIAALPPVIWSVVELCRNRRLDALSLLVIGGIALSLLAMGFGADERVLLIRESWITGGMGLMLLGSACIKRPLLPILVNAIMRRQASPLHAQQAVVHPMFQSSLKTGTWVWGLGLITEAGLRLWMAMHWPIATNLLYGPIISYGIMALLVLWFFCHHRLKMKAGNPY